MDTRLTQSILRHSLLLGIFALVAALLLAIVNANTKERIEAQRLAAERKALAQVLPSARHDNDLLNDFIALNQQNTTLNNLAILNLTEVRNAYIARTDNTITGIILPVEAHDGYSGDILLLVGINADGSLSGVRVVSHKETPGLGDKIDLRISDWILGFNSLSLTTPEASQWQVKKDGGAFDQFVGATITPRAVLQAVKNALLFFEQNKTIILSNQY